MARLDKTRTSTTTALAATNPSASAGPTEPTNARLWRHAPTTILQPTAATSATDASTASTADAQLLPIPAAHASPEQNAPCATPT